MDETKFILFSDNLDPRAQRFPPIYLPNSYIHFNQLNIFTPPPLPPPPPLPVYSPYISTSPVTSPAYEEIRTPTTLTPSRTLLLSLVPTNVSESSVRTELELFGAVRAVQMERLICDGLVTVHFYDLRHAQLALTEIQNQHMQQQLRISKHYNNSLFSPAAAPFPPPAPGLISGHAVWAQFIIPNEHNQGTIVVFNLDSNVSASSLKKIFQAFGPVKELRETPSKQHQKFVEFYDIRDAARAVHEMNGNEIYGNRVMIDFSRPGGHVKKFFNSNSAVDFSSFHLKGKTCIGSVEASMASFCLTKGAVNNEIEERNSKKTTKKQQPTSKSRSMKGRFRNYVPRILINDVTILESNHGDSRTTVMIKNMPNKYSQRLMLDMLDKHCIHCNEQIKGDDEAPSSYDFVYLPIDFKNKCNVGYGFVNMTSPEATWRLYKAFHLHSWEIFKSTKICQITYARVQGLEALKEHFKKSKFPNVKEEIFPVVFSPPRDGKCLSDPQLIFGHQFEINGQEDDDGGGGSDEEEEKFCRNGGDYRQ